MSANQTSNLQRPNSKLRIGFDAKRAFNNQTGLGNYSRFVIEGMVKAFPEHEYYLFTPEIKPAFAGFMLGYNNVHIITPQQFLGKAFKSLWRRYSLTALANKLKLDVFHGLSNELPANIEKFAGFKTVTIHDLIFLRYPFYYKSIDRAIYKRKFKTACAHADVVIAASKQTAEDLVSFFGTDRDKIQVLYQGCDKQFDVKLSELEKNAVRTRYHLPLSFIVCIGTIEQRKNQLTVLKAFHKANISSHLVFVGKQTVYAQQLHQYINENRLQHRVMFIEGAAFADFPAFYQMADLAIYASEFEGFGIPVLEAMKSNTRMIVANASSLPEVGGDAVHYFEAGNEDQLSELIRDVLHADFDEAKAQDQLARFDTSYLMKQLNALYHLQLR